MFKLTPNEIATYRMSYLQFVLGVFKYVYNTEFILSHHHQTICTHMEKIVVGLVQNLVTNIAPRHGKTELTVVCFIPWALGLFPDSEFIHPSYTKALASKNSQLARNIMQSSFYQQVFPHVQLDMTSKAKDHWRTTQGGVMYACGSEGSITGFGAGKMRVDGTFGGAIIADDPHKPNEAESDARRQAVLDTWCNTIQNRVNSPNTPKVVVMQRVHEDDLSGFLLRSGDGEKWDHLCLPSISEDNQALWPFKHTLPQLQAMEKANPYVFAAQHMQDPTPKGGAMFKEEWWVRYPAPPATFEYTIMTCDTAQRTNTHNDYSVVQHWGKWSNKCWLIDQIRGKWEPQDLEDYIVNFFNNAKHRPLVLYMEDASSGTRLIDILPQRHSIPVSPVKRTKDKFARACDVLNYINSGLVAIPETSPWIEDYLLEMGKFSPANTHKHDDQVDATVDAISLLMNPPDMYCGIL